jgi:hypothetical protein
MTEDSTVKKIKRWKPIAERPTGRLKLRWEEDVLEDIKNMNVHNWKKVAQDRERWKKVAQDRERWKKVAQDRERWKKVVEQARTSNRL